MNKKAGAEKWVTVRAAIADWNSTLRLCVIIGTFALASLPPSLLIALLLHR